MPRASEHREIRPGDEPVNKDRFFMHAAAPAIESLELKIRQRSPAPQRLRLAQHPRSTLEVAFIKGAMAVGKQRLKPLEIELARLDTQNVPRCPGTSRGRSRSPSSSTRRSRDTWTRSIRSTLAGGAPFISSSIRRSRDTTRFALSSSIASRARCLGPPIATGTPPIRTSSGPRI
jgi:hypothetical protein